MQAHLGIGPRLRFLLARASKKARCLSISTLLLGKASSPSKILITATQSSSSLQQFFDPYGFAGQSGAGTNLTGKATNRELTTFCWKKLRAAGPSQVGKELRIRKMPWISRARLPSAKTRGVVVNCTSDGEKTQKQNAATTARRGRYSRSPAKFSTKISRRFTAMSLYRNTNRSQ